MSDTLKSFFKRFIFFFGITLIVLGAVLSFYSGAYFLGKKLPIFILAVIFGSRFIQVGRKSELPAQIERYFLASFSLLGIYLFLLLVDIVFIYVDPFIKLHGHMQWREMYRIASEPHARRMIPNANKVFFFDNRFIRLQTNSLGHRDKEPDFRPGERNVVISGDSFTYGHGVSQDQTISQRMEHWGKVFGKALNTYNMGCSGYAAHDSYREMKNFLPANTSDYIYAFHDNDFFEDMVPRKELAVYNGMIFFKYGEDGSLNTPARLADMTRDFKRATSAYFSAPETPKRRLQSWFALRHIATYVSYFDLPKLLSAAGEAAPARGGVADCSRKHIIPAPILPGVKETLLYVKRMQEMTRERKIAFHIFMTPGIGDVAGGGYYSEEEAAFICMARDQGVHVMDSMIRDLNTNDFIPGDWHYRPLGADKVAKAAVEGL